MKRRPSPLRQPLAWWRWYTGATSSGSRARWDVAFALDRLLPRVCWADLVSWALDVDRPADERLSLREHTRGGTGRGDSSCEAEAWRTGSCYCGKVRQTATDPYCRGRRVRPRATPRPTPRDLSTGGPGAPGAADRT